MSARVFFFCVPWEDAYYCILVRAPGWTGRFKPRLAGRLSPWSPEKSADVFFLEAVYLPGNTGKASRVDG